MSSPHRGRFTTAPRRTARSSRALRFGVRPYCRTCQLRVFRLSARCVGCSTAYPGLRARLAWQGALIVMVAAVAGCAAWWVG